jgi:hypothetical protein
MSLEYFDPATPPADAPNHDERREPTSEEIARRAYDYFQARGGNDGSDLADWLQAEADMRRERDTAS